jgi:hypothetical protein
MCRSDANPGWGGYLARIFHFTAISPWLATGLVGLCGLMASLPPPPAEATTLMAVFPPWWTQNQVWEAAGSVGYVVGIGGRSWAVVVHSNLNDIAPRLQHAGAWLVLDPRGLGICSTK